MDFGSKIKELRTAQGISQRELAEKVGGVTREAVKHWENNGRTPNVETAHRLAVALDVTVDYLFGTDSTGGNNTQTAHTYQNVPLELISPNPDNFYHIGEIESLAANIEENGLMQPIVVNLRYSIDRDGYEIISGERRYRACKRLYEWGVEEFASIPCIIEDIKSRQQAEYKLISANADTRTLTDYDRTIQAKRTKELLQEMKAAGHKFEGRMRDHIAKTLNTSPTQIARMDSINNNLNSDLVKEYQNGAINFTEAYDLSRQDDDIQAAAAKHLQKHGSLPKKKKTSTAPPPPPTPTPAKQPHTLVHVSLMDKHGNETVYRGNVAIAAAVDTENEEFTGATVHGDDATGDDYALLAITVCKEIFDKIKHNGSAVDLLCKNLTELFGGLD